MELITPRVIVSKCITFASCRWNGLAIASDIIDLMKPHVEFVPVCAEVEIGLGVPRKPIRLVKKDGDIHLMQSETEADVTERMKGFATSYLEGLGDVDGFVLKGRSPSCGIGNVKVYPSMGRVASLREKRAGLFAEQILQRFSHLPIEEEGRLTNFSLREHFLTRLFAVARLRALLASPSMKDLVEFHTHNKYLLMAYSQIALSDLGKIVANHEHKPLSDVIETYAPRFRAAFEKQPRRSNNVNVLTHALGYFKEGLSKGEKAFFMESLDKYVDRKFPLSVPLSIIKSNIVRFGEQYLSNQTYFDPYPEGLMELKDSGEGRKL